MFRQIVVLLAVASLVAADLGQIKTSNGLELCMLFEPRWGSPTTIAAPKWHFVAVEPFVGCTNSTWNITNAAALAGKVAVFARGVCLFSVKVAGAKASGAVGVIIVSTNNDMTTPIAANATDYSLGPQLPVAMVTADDGATLLSQPASTTLYMAPTGSFSKLDPNIIVFFIFSLGCIVCGSLWAHTRDRRLLFGTSLWLQPSGGGSGAGGAGPGGAAVATPEEPFQLTPTAVAVFFVASSCMLLALYFLYAYLYYIVLSIFCIASTVSVHRILDVFLALSPFRPAPRPVAVPYVGVVTLWSLLFAGTAMLFVVLWAVYRASPSAWIAQDFLGLCFLASTIQTIRLPSLRLATGLLGAFVVYDVFFVFITPLLTSSHQSVMVTAATGGSSDSQPLPIVISLPRFISPPCVSASSLLGFGDVILPALLASFCRSFDLHRRRPGWSLVSRNLYFFSFLGAYAIGLFFTYVALVATSSAQPALLYLVPCTLGAVWFVGWRCGDLKTLIPGSFLDEPSERSHVQTTAAATDDSLPSEGDGRATADDSRPLLTED